MKIRQYIIENEMKAGDRLPNELQMAEYCEVGRGTVRDAVKLLRFEGLVEVVQGSGTYLLRQKQKPIEISGGETPNLLGAFLPEELPNKALEFSEVRLMLEPDIAALAATNATYEDCRKLMELEAEVRWQIQMQESHYEKDIEFQPAFFYFFPTIFIGAQGSGPGPAPNGKLSRQPLPGRIIQ